MIFMDKDIVHYYILMMKTKKSLSFNNQNFKNVKQITLNDYFYNMIYDDKFKKFMQKIIDDYDEKNDNKKDDDNINNNLKGYNEIKKDKENEGNEEYIDLC